MSQSVSVMPNSDSPVIVDNSKPIILNSLPDFPIADQKCATKLQQHLDLILLALESLQLGGSEYMLAIAYRDGLNNIIKNRLVLWHLRCSNPWRKCYTREIIELDQAKALVIIASEYAKSLVVLIRQLIIAEQQMIDKNIPLENSFKISEYLTRFKTHFRSRMNNGRAKVSVYLSSPDELNQLAMSLLNQLLFCTGAKGMERFWVSLFDGEVI